MAMFEIKERTEVTEPDGSKKTILPGRVTVAEAEQYGLTKTEKAEPAKKTRKKAS